MTVIVYSWSLGVFGAILPTPPTGREILTIENQGFDTTNMKLTLFLRNTGSTPTTLASYYIQDQNGNQYARTTWSVPATSPASIVNGTGVFLFINAACISCTHAGNSFQFQVGHASTITCIAPPRHHLVHITRPSCMQVRHLTRPGLFEATRVIAERHLPVYPFASYAPHSGSC